MSSAGSSLGVPRLSAFARAISFVMRRSTVYVFGKVFDAPVAFPLLLDNIGPLGPGKYRAYLISYDDKKCPIQGPNPKAGGWYSDFTVINAGYANPAGQPSKRVGQRSGGWLARRRRGSEVGA